MTKYSLLTGRRLRLTLALLLISVLTGCVGVRQTLTAPTEAGAIQIRQLSPNTWLHTSTYTYPGGTVFPSNGLIVRDGNQLTLIDTAWGEIATQALLRQIKQQIALPVTRAIVTHAHGDRAAGVDVLEAANVVVFAHPLTRTLAARSGMAVADKPLDELNEPGSSTRLGRIEVLYPGPGHAPDNLVAWLADERLLFGGCAVRAADTNSVGNTADAQLEPWRDAIQDILKRYSSADLVIPGHGDPGDIGLLSHTINLLNDAIAEP